MAVPVAARDHDSERALKYPPPKAWQPQEYPTTDPSAAAAAPPPTTASAGSPAATGAEDVPAGRPRELGRAIWWGALAAAVLAVLIVTIAVLRRDVGSDDRPQTVAAGTAVAVTIHGAQGRVNVTDARVLTPGLIVFTVTFFCAEGTLEPNSLDLQLRDGSGKTYNRGYPTDVRQFHSARLLPQDTITGDVVFEAPESVLHGGTVELRPDLHVVAVWTLG